MLKHWQTSCFYLMRLMSMLKDWKRKAGRYLKCKGLKGIGNCLAARKVAVICIVPREKNTEKGFIIDKYDKWQWNVCTYFENLFDLKFNHDGRWFDYLSIARLHDIRTDLHASSPTPSISASASTATSITVAGETWIARTPSPPPSPGWRRQVSSSDSSIPSHWSPTPRSRW